MCVALGGVRVIGGPIAELPCPSASVGSNGSFENGDDIKGEDNGDGCGGKGNDDDCTGKGDDDGCEGKLSEGRAVIAGHACCAPGCHPIHGFSSGDTDSGGGCGVCVGFTVGGVERIASIYFSTSGSGGSSIFEGRIVLSLLTAGADDDTY